MGPLLSAAMASTLDNQGIVCQRSRDGACALWKEEICSWAAMLCSIAGMFEKPQGALGQGSISGTSSDGEEWFARCSASGGGGGSADDFIPAILAMKQAAAYRRAHGDFLEHLASQQELPEEQRLMPLVDLLLRACGPCLSLEVLREALERAFQCCKAMLEAPAEELSDCAGSVVSSIDQVYGLRETDDVSVRLTGVRVLSIGKVSVASGGERGSEEKAEGKDVGTSACNGVPVVPVYLGQDGLTICALAFGQELVEKVQAEFVLGSVVNVVGLRIAAGPELRWTEGMRITPQRDQEDSEEAGEFWYDIEEAKECCTVASAHERAVGEHVALLLTITTVEQQGRIEDENVFVAVTGSDRMGQEVTLGLWGFSKEDIRVGSTCIIRGLLISQPHQVHDDEWGEEMPQKILVCSYRTAVEQVSTIGALADLLGGKHMHHPGPPDLPGASGG